MITNVLHAIAAHPRVYDRIQQLAGAEEFFRYLRQVVGPVPRGAVVLDVGGGTGSAKSALELPGNYLCLDPDMAKLHGFAAKYGPGGALLGDGTHLPLQTGAVDLLFCINVFHHLPDAALASVVTECQRVVKPTGRAIFVDPVWDPTRRVGRLIWRYDRGSHPRTLDTLHTTLQAHAHVLRFESFAIYHRYMVAVTTNGE